MSEALWAQVIAGAFGLASIALGTYLPTRFRRRENQDRDRDSGDGGGKGYYRPRRSSDRDTTSGVNRRRSDEHGDGPGAASQSGVGK